MLQVAEPSENVSCRMAPELTLSHHVISSRVQDFSKPGMGEDDVGLKKKEVIKYLAMWIHVLKNEKCSMSENSI